MSGGEVFSKIGLSYGYYQVKIKEGDIYKDYFITRYGHYEFVLV